MKTVNKFAETRKYTNMMIFVFKKMIPIFIIIFLLLV